MVSWLQAISGALGKPRERSKHTLYKDFRAGQPRPGAGRECLQYRGLQPSDQCLYNELEKETRPLKGKRRKRFWSYLQPHFLPQKTITLHLQEQKGLSDLTVERVLALMKGEVSFLLVFDSLP